MGKKHGNTAARLAMGLHTRMREARVAAGITREQMAGWLGVHVTNYSRIETGSVSVSAERVGQIARLLGVSVASLYGELEKAAG